MSDKDTDKMKEGESLLPEPERHPWPPFVPPGAKVLIMGTFPPQPKRWSMDFYYPNRTNDFWKVCGLLFLGDEKGLYLPGGKGFDIEAVKRLMTEKRIALNDTAREVRRLRGNASDKYLEIVRPVPLAELLAEMPDCHDVATTGEKAAGVVAELTGTAIPKMGEYAETESGLRLWRMPSTSRAYPLPLEQKTAYYRRLFQACGILPA